MLCVKEEPMSGPWDVIVVGAGHNGLTCATYLAQPSLFSTQRDLQVSRSKGLKVLVLEKRDRIGGACTLRKWSVGSRQCEDKPAAELVVSPCAYLAGLLHPLVIQELDLEARGLAWTPASAGMFVLYSDGSSILLHDDDLRCEQELVKYFPNDVQGWKSMNQLCDKVRCALLPMDYEKDMWLGPAPTFQDIERRLKESGLSETQQKEGMKLLFEWSIIDLLDHFLTDEKLKLGLMGQGIIGSFSSPSTPGTAYIFFHHLCGRMFNMPGQWGYIKGGMGKISELIGCAAQSVGVSIHTNCPVSRILPGKGVVLEDGQEINAPIIVSNADPRTTLALLGPHADLSWKEKVLRVPMKGCTVKVNVAMSELPNFKSRPGTFCEHHLAQVEIPLDSREEWEACIEKAMKGELPEKLWCELYFQTSVDTSVCTSGEKLHHMSVFAQYVPYAFAEGTWNTRREDVARVVLNSIGRHCSNIPSAVVSVEVLGPPDIEEQIGLWGGHIFQGECLPEYMWANRLSPQTPMDKVYLCGASTHPGGSVIACNGRNAAARVIQDLCSTHPEQSV